MCEIKIGDVVARKSYGGDIPFTVVDIVRSSSGKPIYVLKGLVFRIQADSFGDDLLKQDSGKIGTRIQNDILDAKRHAVRELRSFRGPLLFRMRARAGKVLHMDGDSSFLDTCLEHYEEARVKAVGKASEENNQPLIVREMLEQYKPDILVLTGHDGVKKNSANTNSAEGYRNSKYFIQAVQEARKYEPSFDKLCIFAGACQSYYEGIMSAGANFASSPGRILINALDPAFVAEKIALTDSRVVVTPKQIASVTISGSDGVWGINTRGHMNR